MLKLSAVATLLYGVFLFLGALNLYRLNKKKLTLWLGSIFAACLVLDGLAALKGWDPTPRIGTLVMAMVFAFFCLRFWQTRKFFPAGLTALISLAVLTFDVVAFFSRQ